MVTLENSHGMPSTISLQDLKEAMFNGHSTEKSDLDVFSEMANEKSDLLTGVEQNPKLLEKAGSARRIRKEIAALKERYGKELQTIAASKSFQAKVEKQSWGRWALNKVKSVALYPVKHPWKTAFILLIVLGLGYYAAGTFSGIIAQLHGLVSDSVLARLQGLDAAAGAARPGMGPGMEVPGGGGSAGGMFKDFKFKIPPSAPVPPPAPPMA